MFCFMFLFMRRCHITHKRNSRNPLWFNNIKRYYSEFIAIKKAVFSYCTDIAMSSTEGLSYTLWLRINLIERIKSGETNTTHINFWLLIANENPVSFNWYRYTWTLRIMNVLSDLLAKRYAEFKPNLSLSSSH